MLRVLKMGSTHCPETSVRNYHYSLRNNQDERNSHLPRGGSRNSFVFYCYAGNDDSVMQQLGPGNFSHLSHKHNRGNVHIMYHTGAFVKPMLQWKSNKYYIFWVYVCSLWYPAWNAHAPCWHVACLDLQYFATLSHRRPDFRKKCYWI